MTKEEANTIQILNGFDELLGDLVSEHLVGKVSKTDINEYYGFMNDCQIAEKFEEAEDVDNLLKGQAGTQS